MKTILLAASMLTALSLSAFAADMPSRKPPVVAPVAAPLSWIGLYVGANAGYAFGASSQRDGFAVADGDYHVKGGVIGGAVGYNWQFQNYVYGLEADASFASIAGSSSACGLNFSDPHLCGTKSDAFGSARLRGGYLIDTTLVYATGGLAVARIKAYDAGFTAVAAASGSGVKTGWTIGAGVERKLDTHWSVKAEYLYARFARASYFELDALGPEKVDLSANIVRVGVNYKF